MKIWSAAKLKRAQESRRQRAPVRHKMPGGSDSLAAQIPEDFHHPLLDARGDEVICRLDHGGQGIVAAPSIPT